MKKAFSNNLQWIKPDGFPTDYFRDLIQSLSTNGLRDPVAVTAPTNGQVMIFDATSGLWKPGAN